MLNKRSKKYIILLILILGFFLRIWRVSEIPPSFSWDEVSTGFDANSILQTGRDQFGNFLPLSFRSLDDYKPPVYTYLASASIKLFGWNDLAVRFPAVILGTLSILGTYLLVTELFKNEKLALLSALILTISPWQMHFSRLALESNSVIFFTAFGTWLFFKGLPRSMYLPLSILTFGLGLYTYHSARVVIPVLVITLIILNYKKIKIRTVGVWLSGLLGLFLIWQMLYTATSISGQMRFRGASIFTEALSLETASEKETYSNWQKVDAQMQDRLGKYWHSDKVLYASIFIRNYFKHLDPNFWLFSDNDTLRHHIQGMGIIYLIELPLLVFGIYFLLSKVERKIGLFVLIWFFVSIIPAALTRDVPHAMRIAVMMPMPQIFIALGLYHVSKKLEQKDLLLFGTVIIAGLYLVNNAFFLHQYFQHYAIDSSEDWRFGRKEAALFAESVKNEYEKILVSTNLEYPHVFFLYYLRYDPVKYLAEGGTVSGGWGEVKNKFGKYEFLPFNFGDLNQNNYLFIGKPDEFPSNVVPLQKIYYLNGKEAIWLVEGNYAATN